METIPIGTNPKTLKLNYTYNKTSGFTQISRYGVYIVRNIWPDEILKIVDDSIDRLETQQYVSICFKYSVSQMEREFYKGGSRKNVCNSAMLNLVM